jgi:cysteine desulfurase
MLPVLTGHFGNPSGSHRVSRDALAILDDARERIARVFGIEPGGVVLTSGGTESDNLAIFGARDQGVEERSRGGGARGRGTLVCSAVEHPAVLEPCTSLDARVVGVHRTGLIDLDALAAALGPDVALVSVMLANNEVGVVQPLHEVVTLVHERAPRALVHTDAVHAAPWMDLRPVMMEVDLLSVSAHKFGGPKGAGALMVRPGVTISPIVLGGSQERGRRAGTNDVAAAVGMATALEAGIAGLQSGVEGVTRLRDRLAEGLMDALDGVSETVPDRSSKVPGSCHMLFDRVDNQELLLLLDEAGVFASAGSACSSGALRSSHVLDAMGISPHQAKGAVRFSLGMTTTRDEIDHALDVVPRAVRQLRRQ